MKSYTNLEQLKKLAEFLPFNSADMVLPFTHEENNEYVPGYAVSRNYMEVYNEMLLLPAMDKDTISKLIQPAWSLAALFDVLPKNLDIGRPVLATNYKGYYWVSYFDEYMKEKEFTSKIYNNPVDACVEMILKLHELKML